MLAGLSKLIFNDFASNNKKNKLERRFFIDFTFLAFLLSFRAAPVNLPHPFHVTEVFSLIAQLANIKPRKKNTQQEKIKGTT